jgi:hypothetical protein
LFHQLSSIIYKTFHIFLISQHINHLYPYTNNCLVRYFILLQNISAYIYHSLYIKCPVMSYLRLGLLQTLRIRNVLIGSLLFETKNANLLIIVFQFKPSGVLSKIRRRRTLLFATADSTIRHFLLSFRVYPPMAGLTRNL